MEKKNASMRMAMYVRIKLVLWVNSDFRGCIISAYVHMYVSMHECMYVCMYLYYGAIGIKP